MNPQDYLRSLWEKLHQTYRNAQAGAYSTGQNNPFNNPYFQSLTQGKLTSQGLPGAPASTGQYGNDLSGVIQGLLSRMHQTAQPGIDAAKDAYTKLFQK